MVAVDFTGSNGNPASHDSLHHIDPSGHRLNQYQQAIASVGAILEAYDNDKKYPVFGFGAKVALPGGQWTAVQHCFPILPPQPPGQDPSQLVMECSGVQGILQAYAGALHCVALSGPTFFGPIIGEASRRAAASDCSQRGQKYLVLLILTDGLINDMQETIAALVSASNLPMSVIIIGVGNENFSGEKQARNKEIKK